MAAPSTKRIQAAVGPQLAPGELPWPPALTYENVEESTLFITRADVDELCLFTVRHVQPALAMSDASGPACLRPSREQAYGAHILTQTYKAYHRYEATTGNHKIAEWLAL